MNYFSKVLLISLLVFISFNFMNAQENEFNVKIEDKAIIIFPEIIPSQVTLIKNKIQSISKIQSAIYVYGKHNCMLFTFNTQDAKYTVYDELLKEFYTIYPIKNCRKKTNEAFPEIMKDLLNNPYSVLK